MPRGQAGAGHLVHRQAARGIPPGRVEGDERDVDGQLLHGVEHRDLRGNHHKTLDGLTHQVLQSIQDGCAIAGRQARRC